MRPPGDERYYWLRDQAEHFRKLADAVDHQLLAQLFWSIAREEPERFDEASHNAWQHYWCARFLMGVE